MRVVLASAVTTAMAMLAFGGSAPVLAADPVKLDSSVYIERTVPTSNGKTARVLEPARAFRKGDRVVYVVDWKAPRANTFMVTNPLPRTVYYERSADGFEEVSINGGRTWGDLAVLRIREADGSIRSASPEDVTHVRWNIPRQIAAAGAGRLTFSGIVR